MRHKKNKKGKIINAVATALSTPSRVRAKRSMARDTDNVRAIKNVREKRNVPDGGNYKSQLFRDRATVAGLRHDRELRRKKKK